MKWKILNNYEILKCKSLKQIKINLNCFNLEKK